MKTYSKQRKTNIKQKKLTKYEEYVFEKIRKEYLTPNQLLKIRNKLPDSELKLLNIKNKSIKIRAIYKTISLIEHKLGSKIMFTKSEENQMNIPVGSVYRLHAQGFSIKIQESTSQYLKQIKESNVIVNDNNTINLYDNNIVIWSNVDFFGKTVQETLDRASEYWNLFLKKIQLDIGVILIKRGSTKIYEFRKHIAHVNDPMAKILLKQKKHYHIRDDNGEIIFTLDDSFSMKELEGVHKTKAVKNITRYERMLRDLDRHPDSLDLGDLSSVSMENTKIINKLLKQQLEMQKDINDLVKCNQVLTQNVLLMTQLSQNKDYDDDFKPSMTYLE